MKPRTVEDQERICRTEWFKDHQANVVLSREEVVIIDWRKPGTSNYACRFVIIGGTLTVLGDIGEAVYGWSSRLTLDFLAGLDFGYFHSKCCASEKGTRFNQWEPAPALRALHEFIKDDEEWSDAEKRREFMEEADRCSSHPQDWGDFIYRSEHASKIRDDDFTLASRGFVPHVRCIGHFAALQMAIAQVRERVAEILAPAAAGGS